MPTRLRDQAYEVWASLSSAQQRDSTIVRDKLHSAFAMGPDAATYELYRRRLQPGESVDAYLGSMKRLMTLIGDVSNEVMTVHFLQGLPSDVRLTVRNSVGDGTLTLERAVAIADRRWRWLPGKERLPRLPPSSCHRRHSSGRPEGRLAVHRCGAGPVARLVTSPGCAQMGTATALHQRHGHRHRQLPPQLGNAHHLHHCERARMPSAGRHRLQ